MEEKNYRIVLDYTTVGQHDPSGEGSVTVETIPKKGERYEVLYCEPLEDGISAVIKAAKVYASHVMAETGGKTDQAFVDAKRTPYGGKEAEAHMTYKESGWRSPVSQHTLNDRLAIKVKYYDMPGVQEGKAEERWNRSETREDVFCDTSEIVFENSVEEYLKDTRGERSLVRRIRQFCLDPKFLLAFLDTTAAILKTAGYEPYLENPSDEQEPAQEKLKAVTIRELTTHTWEQDEDGDFRTVFDDGDVILVDKNAPVMDDAQPTGFAMNRWFDISRTYPYTATIVRHGNIEAPSRTMAAAAALYCEKENAAKGDFVIGISLNGDKK